MAPSPAVPAGLRDALAPLAADLRRIFATRLQALVAYGLRQPDAGDPLLHTLALVDSLTFDDLAACAPQTANWKRSGLAVPLLMSVEEFRRTLDVFPLEYDQILMDHVVIEGADPFDGLRVPETDLRRACELQAKSHLIHLREGFLEGSREPRAIAGLIASSAPAFRSLVTNIARLDGLGARHAAVTPADDESLAAAAERIMGVQRSAVREILAAPRTGSTAVDPTALLARYIDAAAQVWRYVDRWRAP